MEGAGMRLRPKNKGVGSDSGDADFYDRNGDIMIRS